MPKLQNPKWQALNLEIHLFKMTWQSKTSLELSPISSCHLSFVLKLNWSQNPQKTRKFMVRPWITWVDENHHTFQTFHCYHYHDSQITLITRTLYWVSPEGLWNKSAYLTVNSFQDGYVFWLAAILFAGVMHVFVQGLQYFTKMYWFYQISSWNGFTGLQEGMEGKHQDTKNPQSLQPKHSEAKLHWNIRKYPYTLLVTRLPAYTLQTIKKSRTF